MIGTAKISRNIWDIFDSAFYLTTSFLFCFIALLEGQSVVRQVFNILKSRIADEGNAIASNGKI
jgi:predicted PurR-regulated permease PerM